MRNDTDDGKVLKTYCRKEGQLFNRMRSVGLVCSYKSCKQRQVKIINPMRPPRLVWNDADNIKVIDTQRWQEGHIVNRIQIVVLVCSDGAGNLLHISIINRKGQRWIGVEQHGQAKFSIHITDENNIILPSWGDLVSRSISPTTVLPVSPSARLADCGAPTNHRTIINNQEDQTKCQSAICEKGE